MPWKDTAGNVWQVGGEEEFFSCCDMTGGYPDCSCGGGGYGQADPSTKPSGELKTVSHCCRAELLKDGDRFICARCRVGAKPVQVSSSSG